MPAKAAYQAFETSPDVEFEFFLATKLHLSVDRLRAELSNDEFIRWSVYYARVAQQQELAQGGGGHG